MGVLQIFDQSINCGITGFEDPTSGSVRKSLSLSKQLVHHPSSTKLTVAHQDVPYFGISDGDYLLVDSSLQPEANDCILVEYLGENALVSFQEIQKQEDIVVQGVVSARFHWYRKGHSIPIHNSLKEFDLHELLIPPEQQHTCVLMRANGKSMLPIIDNGDLLLLNRSLSFKEDHPVIMALNGELVCKRLNKRLKKAYSDNPKFRSVYLSSSDEIRIYGCVSMAIRIYRRELRGR